MSEKRESINYNSGNIVQTKFVEQFLDRVRNNLYNFFDDNCPYHQMKQNGAGINLLKAVNMQSVFDAVKDIMIDVDMYVNVYDLLEDEQSKQLLVKLVVFNVLGYRRYKLPLSNKEYFLIPQEIEKNCILDEEDALDVVVRNRNKKIYKMALSSLGKDVVLYCSGAGIRNIVVNRQYEYETKNTVICPEAGDVVIDAGACWGEQAVFFASQIGSEGRVFSFEVTHSAKEIFHQNVALNPKYGRNIKLIEKALWNKSGDILKFYDAGPGTSLVGESQREKSFEVETETLDNLVFSGVIPRVDFIKMDIEGAELNALQGAIETIRKFHPKLAISVYHNEGQDLLDIPVWLNQLGLGYDFYLGHYTIHNEETVLYATTK